MTCSSLPCSRRLASYLGLHSWCRPVSAPGLVSNTPRSSSVVVAPLILLVSCGGLPARREHRICQFPVQHAPERIVRAITPPAHRVLTRARD
jgi:hypothetical protein